MEVSPNNNVSTCFWIGGTYDQQHERQLNKEQTFHNNRGDRQYVFHIQEQLERGIFNEQQSK